MCLDLSPDGGMLAVAGVDAQGRQQLVCWDVAACWEAGNITACASISSGGSFCTGGAASSGCGKGSCRPRELARQVSDYNIQSLKFVPYEPHRLVTCGKNSIRIYRCV